MLAKTNWRPGRKEIRYFANTLAFLGIVLALVFLIAGKQSPALVIAAAGLFLAAIARVVPVIGRWLYLAWTGATFVLSLIVSPIVIAIIYYIILAPIALLARLAGKDELRLKRCSNLPSYFDDAACNSSPESFRRQF